MLHRRRRTGRHDARACCWRAPASTCIVLEKHADFLRDFRGDTIHPSTLELMHELGLLDEFLKLPHQKVDRSCRGRSARTRITIADFSHLPTRCKFIALMPQWDFLDFLADQGARYPAFHLHMSTEATRLIEKDGKVSRRSREDAGRRARDRAPISSSAPTAGIRPLREQAGLDGGGSRRADGRAVVSPVAQGDRRRRDRSVTSRRAGCSVMINRGDYWQCAYVIPKGGLDALKQRGLEAFRDGIVLHVAVRARPHRRNRELGRREAAHRRRRPAAALVQGRLAAASATPRTRCRRSAASASISRSRTRSRRRTCCGSRCRQARLTLENLQAVQTRREWPVRVTQRLQIAVQNRIIGPLLQSTERPRAPWPLKLFDIFPVLRRIPARLIGIGVRPEHIHTPERM